MNIRNILSTAACAIALAMSAAADPVNTSQLFWGSQEESIIVDSNGNPLPADNFTFDLGAFVVGFTPTDENVDQWAANWRSFSTATYSYNETTDRSEFAAEYTMYESGNFNPGSSGYGDFEDLGISRTAYIWVYNNQSAVEGSEWFLARALTWEFPTLTEDCCGNDLPIQWSLGDLWDAGVVPVWGGQGGEEGAGEYTVFNSNADLQTFTFIPEPSSSLLLALGCLLVTLRRHRAPKAV